MTAWPTTGSEWRRWHERVQKPRQERHAASRNPTPQTRPEPPRPVEVATLTMAERSFPPALQRWEATVIDLGDNDDAEVQLSGDTSSTLWVPLEVSGVSVGSKVVVDFRDGGGAAVTRLMGSGA